jgi:hypothetical protein
MITSAGETKQYLSSGNCTWDYFSLNEEAGEWTVIGFAENIWTQERLSETEGKSFSQLGVSYFLFLTKHF